MPTQSDIKMLKGHAIFFVTHIFNGDIEKRFLKIVNDLKGISDVFICAPSSLVIPGIYLNVTIFFDINMIYGYGSDGKTRGYSNNLHYLPVFINKKFNHYHYHWYFEYDVVYTGNWLEVIVPTINDESDLISINLYNINHPGARKWVWWDSFNPPFDIGENNTFRALLSSFRISSKGIAITERLISEGWRGIYEAVLPSGLAYYKCKLSQLGGQGVYVPHDRIGLFYKSYPIVFTALGNFRVRPQQYFLLKSHTLYHPVKIGLSKISGFRHILTMIYQYFIYLIK